MAASPFFKSGWDPFELFPQFSDGLIPDIQFPSHISVDHLREPLDDPFIASLRHPPFSYLRFDFNNFSRNLPILRIRRSGDKKRTPLDSTSPLFIP
jgi:hypothetical protein